MLLPPLYDEELPPERYEDPPLYDELLDVPVEEPLYDDELLGALVELDLNDELFDVPAEPDLGAELLCAELAPVDADVLGLADDDLLLNLLGLAFRCPL